MFTQHSHLIVFPLQADVVKQGAFKGIIGVEIEKVHPARHGTGNYSHDDGSLLDV